MISSRRKFIQISLLGGAASVLGSNLSAFPADFKKDFLLGICAGPDKSALLKQLGYDYIEPPVIELLKPLENDEAFQTELLKLKQSALPAISCINFIPATLKSVGPEPLHDQILSYAETTFRRAGAAKLKYIVFGSGGSRRIPEGFAKDKAVVQFKELLSRMAPLAQKNNIIIVIEPLNKGEVNFINSLEEGAEIVNSVNHKNVRLLTDIYHMLKENESPAEILKYGKLIYHCHIAEKETRSAPGIKGDDFRPYLDALRSVGYKGGISLECRWTDFDSEAASGLEHMKKIS